MGVEETYKEIDNILNIINFNKLWRGFKKYNFAIYDDEKVYFGDRIIPVDNRFVGNTATHYDGEKIAIWKISDKDLNNLDILASNIIHEMFHAFQLENKESRFSNDLKGLNRPFDTGYYQIKKREAILLREALQYQDLDGKIHKLVEIITLRERRANLYKDITEYEFAIETIEGMAEYIATKALQSINKKEYEKRINNYTDMIVDNKIIFDTRRYSYFYGTLLLILVDTLNITVSQEIENNNKTVMEDFMVIIKERKKVEEVPTDKDLEKELYDYHNNIIAKFEKFYAGKIEDHPGIYKIVGYDPMNMYKLGDKILHKYFVNLYNNHTKETLFIKGPVVTIFNKDESFVIDYLS